MKRLLVLILVAAHQLLAQGVVVSGSAVISGSVVVAQTPPATNNTWYVRPDGGTRYSSNVTTGQCNGLGDAPYPGTGIDQNCAFNDVRMLWTDCTYADGNHFPAWGWLPVGGDTMIIRGSIGTGVSYRVGANTGSTYTGCSIAGDPGDSGAPAFPSGTSSQHTKFLGENFAACHSNSSKTQLHGGMGVNNVLNMYGVSYVDVACLDMTDWSACGRASQIQGCDNTQDWAGQGIQFHNTSTFDTLTDIAIHGMGAGGIVGSTGNGVVADYLTIVDNPVSGWNADAGDGTTGVGSLNIFHFNISWNGCAEEYPIVDAIPAYDCTDQSSGGYGDGFGTATVASASPGWQVHFDQGIVSYNTQDGLDALHISGPGSTMTDTRVLAFGNEGNQLKVGGATATIQNSVINGNCYALGSNPLSTTFSSGATSITATASPSNPLVVNQGQVVLGPGIPANTFATATVTVTSSGTAVPISNATTAAETGTTTNFSWQIPGTPSGFGSRLQDYCRAGNVAVLINVTPGDPAYFQGNTVFSEGAIFLEVEYATSDTGNTNTLAFNDNVFVGFENPGNSQNPTPIYSNTDLNMLTNPGASWTNNATYGQRNNWPCPWYQGDAAAVCGDPGLVDETYHPYGYGNVAPASSSSAVVGAGVYLSALPVDFSGVTRANPPAIGAYEYAP